MLPKFSEYPLIELARTTRITLDSILRGKITIKYCKFLNARFECKDIVIFIYSHYPLDPNAKSSDTKCVTFGIKYFAFG